MEAIKRHQFTVHQTNPIFSSSSSFSLSLYAAVCFAFTWMHFPIPVRSNDNDHNNKQQEIVQNQKAVAAPVEYRFPGDSILSFFLSPLLSN